MEEGLEVLEMYLACEVRPVCLNKLHIGLGTAAGDALAWLLDELFELVVVSLVPNFVLCFWRHVHLSQQNKWVCLVALP